MVSNRPIGDYVEAILCGFRREFVIVSKMNNLVIDVKGENAGPGAELVMWHRKHPHAKNQLWYQDNQGIIRSALNDFAIDAGIP